jgi:AraC-like DNA-binding protein
MTSFEPSSFASSKTSTFADPELYQQAVRTVQAEVVSVGRGKFYSELTKVDFKRLWMQRGHERLARIASLHGSAERVAISFAARMDQAPTFDSGMEVSPGEIVFHGLAKTYHVRTVAENQWAAMSLTPEDLAAIGYAITGREISAPAVRLRVRPAPRLMSRLLRLHEVAGHIAKTLPDLLTHPEVTRALEQKLLHVMVRCLADGAPAEEGGTTLRHAATLARFEALLMANYDRPLHLSEICAAIGVSERTLRVCCQEQLGMGPNHYLWLRRMNLTHRTLLRSIPATATVTEIAMAHGFWELGRFAVRYRALFGEPPAASLARPPVDRPTARDHPFALAIRPLA